LLHPVDDSFLFAQRLYLLEASSTTGFFFFLMVDQGCHWANTGLFPPVFVWFEAGTNNWPEWALKVRRVSIFFTSPKTVHCPDYPGVIDQPGMRRQGLFPADGMGRFQDIKKHGPVTGPRFYSRGTAGNQKLSFTRLT
jgi:hypothetical protein